MIRSVIIGLAVGATFIIAGQVGDLIQFKPNTVAKSSEVNENFNRIKNAVNDNYSRIQSLEQENQQLQQTVQQLQQQNQQLQQTVQQLQQTVQQLQNQIAQKQNRVTGTCPSNQAIKQINEDGTVVCETSLDTRITSIENSNVMAMDNYVEVINDPYVSNAKTIRFTRVNVQIVNGTGQTYRINGLGNLIIGYNTPRVAGQYTCSLGQYWNNQTDCQNNGGIWALSFKTGSHNLIVGDRTAYSSFGGIVVGYDNVISNPYAVVIGGYSNIAAGRTSNVSGGRSNVASGLASSVSGGQENIASGLYSSVNGGKGNRALGTSSSISGGFGNTASGDYSSVSGGSGNTASGHRSSVSGGQGNTASGNYSSVSGGAKNNASGNYSTVGGGWIDDNGDNVPDRGCTVVGYEQWGTMYGDSAGNMFGVGGCTP